MIHHLPPSVLAVGTELRSSLKPETSAQADPAAQTDLERLQGAWVLVYWLYDGKEQSLEGGKIVLSLAGERFTIRIGGAVTEEGAFERLDPGRNPKAFDYAPTVLYGRPVQLVFPAIYRLQGDEFVACVGYAGKRPTAFSAEAGSKNELVIYKRMKE